MSQKVIVIGAGVSGMTTALTLQLFGYDTVCLTRRTVNDDGADDPRFASLFPAASVIPHSVHTDHLDRIFPPSLAVFDLLHRCKMEGMARHRHYELFEFERSIAAYARLLPNFSPAKELDPHRLPRRREAPELHGWAFDCFVAEWPAYMHRLYQLYRQAGGTLIRQKVEPEDIASLRADILINCAGYWAPDLFDDPVGRRLIRGHLLHIPDRKAVSDRYGRTLSYNYTPLPDIYATPDGAPSDVYFYPVAGKWILGGSRQRGCIDDEGQWQGQSHADTINIDGVDVPRPIVELNQSILDYRYHKHVDLSSCPIKARIGYRYSRAHARQGLRIESEEAHDKLVIHNYGHGGAGVTLSWGCALHVYHLLEKSVKRQPRLRNIAGTDPPLRRLQLTLQKSYMNYT